MCYKLKKKNGLVLRKVRNIVEGVFLNGFPAIITR
jgi:hypothetical protein